MQTVPHPDSSYDNAPYLGQSILWDLIFKDLHATPSEKNQRLWDIMGRPSLYFQGGSFIPFSVFYELSTRTHPHNGGYCFAPLKDYQIYAQAGSNELSDALQYLYSACFSPIKFTHCDWFSKAPLLNLE